MEKDKYLLPIMLLFIGGIGVILWNKNKPISKPQTKSIGTNYGGETQPIIIEKSTEENTGTTKPMPYSPPTGTTKPMPYSPPTGRLATALSSKPIIANPTSMNADGNTYYTKYSDVL